MRYGKEIILDIHDCEVGLRFTRSFIEAFMIQLCELIDMQREDLHFWDYEGDEEGYNNAPEHLKGISAVQFIKTSNVTLHTLDDLNRVYLNIFSCKDFDGSIVRSFAERFFNGRIVNTVEVDRL